MFAWMERNSLGVVAADNCQFVCRPPGSKYSPLSWQGHFDEERDIQIEDSENVELATSFWFLGTGFLCFDIDILILDVFPLAVVSRVSGRNRRPRCVLSSWWWLLRVITF